MVTNWHAMQAAASGERKQRLPVNDANIKQMTMGSWHASLSHNGAAIHALGRKSYQTGVKGQKA